MSRLNLGARIEATLIRNGGEMRFGDLAVELWPARKSHSYRTEGGPPGCYMALSAGLKRYGFSVTNGLDGKSFGSARIVRSKTPMSKEPTP